MNSLVLFLHMDIRTECRRSFGRLTRCFEMGGMSSSHRRRREPLELQLGAGIEAARLLSSRRFYSGYTPGYRLATHLANGGSLVISFQYIRYPGREGRSWFATSKVFFGTISAQTKIDIQVLFPIPFGSE